MFLLEFYYQCVNAATETVSMMKTITSWKDGGFSTFVRGQFCVSLTEIYYMSSKLKIALCHLNSEDNKIPVPISLKCVNNFIKSVQKHFGIQTTKIQEYWK